MGSEVPFLRGNLSVFFSPTCATERSHLNPIGFTRPLACHLGRAPTSRLAARMQQLLLETLGLETGFWRNRCLSETYQKMGYPSSAFTCFEQFPAAVYIPSLASFPLDLGFYAESRKMWAAPGGDASLHKQLKQGINQEIQLLTSPIPP